MLPALGPEPSALPGLGRKRKSRWIASAVLLVVVALLSVSSGQEPALERIRLEEDLIYRPEFSDACRLDLYRPGGSVPEGGWPVVVAIHGGGWSGGSFRGYGRSVARLSRHGLAVASVGYRLAKPGEPAWPGNRDDIRASVRWLRAHAGQYGLNPDRIAVMGASAGGHLAVLLGTDPGPDVDGISARVSGVVDFYGPADLVALADVPKAQPAVRGLLGGPPEARRALAVTASPVEYVSEGDPPMLLIHGTLDPTVPIGQSRKLAQVLQTCKVPYRLIEVEGAVHGFGLRTPDQDFLPEILEFFAACWDDTVRCQPMESHSATSGGSSLVPDRRSSGP